MSDARWYGPIQGQGHVALKDRNFSIFKTNFHSAVFSESRQMTADS